MPRQPSRFRFVAGGAALVLLAAVACGDSSPTAPGNGGDEDGDVAAVVVTPSEVEVAIGEEDTLDAIARTQDGDEVEGVEFEWSSSDTTVATVNSTGIVTGQGQGDVTITASARGAEGASAATVVPNVPEQTVVVDSTEMELTSTEEERDEGVLRFEVSGESAPDVEVDDVLVGAEDGGFLRRVTSVERQGSELIAETSQAALTEAVEAGSFEAETSLTPGEEQPAVRSRGDVVWGRTRVASTAPSVTVEGGEIDLAGLVITDPSEVLRVEVQEGVLSLEPTVEVGGQIGFPATLEEFHAAVGGDLGFDLQVFAGMTGGGEAKAEVEIVTLQKPFVTSVGPVPLAGVVRLSFVGGAAASADGEVGLETGFQSSNAMRVGARYEDGDWTDILETDATYEPAATEFVDRAGAELRTYVRPEVAVDFYTVAAPFIGAEPYLSGLGESSTSGLELEVAAGLDADLGFQMDILSLAVVDYETELFGVREVLFEKTFDPNANATIYGNVRDFQSLDPISDAAVALEQKDGSLTRQQDTDADGAYRFESLPAGTYRLEATHPDYKNNLADNIEIVELSDGDVVRVDFDLPDEAFGDPVGSVAGRVVDESGAPIEAATVQISGGDQTNGVFKSVKTAADGTYTLSGIVLVDDEGAPIESFTVIADKNGFDAATAENVVIEENRTTTDVDFTLAASTGTDVFFEDGFEDGLAWEASGFWNRTTGQGIVNAAYPTYVSLAPDDESEGALPTAAEGTRYAWYGQPSAGNFLGEQQSGDAEKSGGTSVGPNSGTLASPSFVVPSGASAASLGFDTWFEIESVNPNDQGFDLMIVAVENLATGELVELARLNPQVDPELEERSHIPFTSGGFNRRPVHRPVSLDLGGFIGEEIRIVYVFDTVDNLYNGFRGWIVDDVEVVEEEPVSTSFRAGRAFDTTYSGEIIGERCGPRYCLDRPLGTGERSP